MKKACVVFVLDLLQRHFGRVVGAARRVRLLGSFPACWPFLTVVSILVLVDYFTPAMLGLKVDQEVLGELVKVKSPKAWQTMVDQNVTWTLVVSRWFICLYIDVLPVEARPPDDSKMVSGC